MRDTDAGTGNNPATKPRDALPDRDPALRVVPMPSDANYTGDIFGGWIMSQVDIAGSIPAIALAQGRVVTVAVNSFVFRQPVMIGDLVSFYADVTRIGTTSVTVHVPVEAERPGPASRRVKVTEAEVVLVAVDEKGRPTPILEAIP